MRATRATNPTSRVALDYNASQYATTGGFKHGNTAENLFSIFKRGVIGAYHHVLEAYLARNTAEFDFRYNTRSLSDHERADVCLQGIIGKRLTYRRTDTKPPPRSSYL